MKLSLLLWFQCSEVFFGIDEPKVGASIVWQRMRDERPARKSAFYFSFLNSSLGKVQEVMTIRDSRHHSCWRTNFPF